MPDSPNDSKLKTWLWVLGGLVVVLVIALVVVLVVRDDSDSNEADTPPRPPRRRRPRRPPRRARRRPPPRAAHHHDVALPRDHRRPADVRAVPVRRLAEQQPDERGQRRERRGDPADVRAGLPRRRPAGSSPTVILRPVRSTARGTRRAAQDRDAGPHPHRRSARSRCRWSSSLP